MENLKSLLAAYFSILSFTCYVIIYTYPAGDWISGPSMILYFGAPIILTHIGLCVYYYLRRKSDWVLWFSGFLSLFSLLNVTYYVWSH